MRVNVNRILSEVLGDPYGGPAIARRDGHWILFVWTDAPSGEEVLCRHQDWTKFIWLCGEYARKTGETE